MPTLSLTTLPNTFAICKLDPAVSVPKWALNGPFVSHTWTDEELSIVCPQENIPGGSEMVEDLTIERGFRCLKVSGPLEFSVIGILAALTVPLAAAKVSVFTISTYNTDYLLVRDHDLVAAYNVLRQHGHQVSN